MGTFDPVSKAYGTLNSFGVQPGAGQNSSWALGKHRWGGPADDPAGANTGYWVSLWEPALPASPTWATVFVRFEPSGQSRIDAFWSPDGKIVRWEQSYLDLGLPMRGYPSGNDSPNEFLKPSAFIVGVPPNTYPQQPLAQPALRNVAIYDTALADSELISLVNNDLPVIGGTQLSAGLRPCNTGSYLAKGWRAVETPCGEIAGALTSPPNNAWSSFRKSCGGAMVFVEDPEWPVTATLFSGCNGPNGPMPSSLDNFRRCAGAGDIWNNAGRSTCTFPPGSYRESCFTTGIAPGTDRPMFADGNRLAGSCKRGDGKLFLASLQDYRNCKQDIQNVDGGLSCGPAPPGSYQAKCFGISAAVNGDLHAACASRTGFIYETSLANFHGCTQVIQDFDGGLSCGEPPSGSYQKTCHMIGAQVNGDLTAECDRNATGHPIFTRLEDFRDCKGEIANLGGQLSCNRR